MVSSLGGKPRYFMSEDHFDLNLGIVNEEVTL